MAINNTTDTLKIIALLAIVAICAVLIISFLKAPANNEVLIKDDAITTADNIPVITDDAVTQGDSEIQEADIVIEDNSNESEAEVVDSKPVTTAPSKPVQQQPKSAEPKPLTVADYMPLDDTGYHFYAKLNGPASGEVYNIVLTGRTQPVEESLNVPVKVQSNVGILYEGGTYIMTIERDSSTNTYIVTKAVIATIYD